MVRVVSGVGAFLLSFIDRFAWSSVAAPVGQALGISMALFGVFVELGGHAPVIVADDADLEIAVKASASAKFRNAGQVCISSTRFLVHNRIRDEFTAAFVEHVAQLKVGDGLSGDTTIGPLANARRVAAIVDMTDDARRHGARIAIGGERIGSVGNFFSPTVLTDVPVHADVFNNEPFGPVAAICGFSSLDDAIREANRLPYGLAGDAFTRSFRNVHLLTHGLEVGLLWINQPATPFIEMPFGGVKDSGYGSEGGPEALDSYLVIKSVTVMES